MKTFRFILLILGIALSINSKAEEYQTVSKSSDIYKTIKKQYKIQEIYKVIYSGVGQTFYTMTDKAGIRYLFSQHGSLLVRDYYNITQLEQYDSHIDNYYGWLEETPGALFVRANGASYIITKGGVNSIVFNGSGASTSDHGKCLRLAENTVLEGNLIKEQCYGEVTTNDGKSYPRGYNFYDWGGRKLSPEPAIALYTAGEYALYQVIDKETSVPLWGAYNHRYQNDFIPAMYSNIKYENNAIFVKLHFYQDWVQYTPGKMRKEKSEYHSLEKSMMHKDLVEVYNEMTQKNENGEEFGIVDLLALFQSLTDYYKDRRINENKMIEASKSDDDWLYYYDDPSAAELLNFDNKSAENIMQSFIGVYDTFLSIPNNSIANYLEEQKSACSTEKLFFSIYGRLHDVAVNRIMEKGQERDRRLQIERQQREIREQREAELWMNFATTLINNISNAFSSSSSHSSSSNSRQTKSNNKSSYSNAGSGSSNDSSNSSGISDSRRRLLENNIRDWEKQIEEQERIIETNSKLDSQHTSIIKDCQRRIAEYKRNIEEAKAELRE